MILLARSRSGHNELRVLFLLNIFILGAACWRKAKGKSVLCSLQMCLDVVNGEGKIDLFINLIKKEFTIMAANHRFLAPLRYCQSILLLAITLLLLGIAPVRVQAMSNPPGIPKLVAPADRVNISTLTPTLSWAASSRANNYLLEISPDPAFGSSFIDRLIHATSYTPPALGGLKYGMTYYWRVTAYSADGWTSTPSIPRRFTITLQQSPGDGAYSISGTPTFTWATARGAINYEFYLSNLRPIDFDSPATSSGSKLTKYTPVSTLDDGAWYWAVCVRLSTGQRQCPVYPQNVNPWVMTVTASFPPAPELIWPPSKTITNENLFTPEFSWNELPAGTPDPPFTYQIQIDTHTNFSQPVWDQKINAPYFNQYSENWFWDGVYYWRVRAINGVGAAGKWSATWQLTIDNTAPSTPQQISPSDYTASTSIPKTFRWSKSDGAVNYELFVKDGASNTVLDELVTTTSYTLTSSDPVIGTGDYTWYVIACDAANNCSREGNSFNLKIVQSLPTIPAVPQLIKPVANSYTNDPSFSWLLSDDTLSSELQVSTIGPGFSEPISSMLYEEIVPPGETNIIVTPDPDNFHLGGSTGPIYWRVRSFNSDYSSPWSKVRTFWFSNRAVDQPMLFSPTGDVNLSQRLPTFSWRTVRGAVRYDLQITDSSGTTRNITLTNKTSYSPPGNSPLDFGAVSWNVTARDVYGNQSVISIIGKFNIVIQNSPAAGSNTTNERPTFKWSAYRGANSYELIITNVGDTSAPVLDKTIEAGTSYTLNSTEVLAPGVYTWQVIVNDVKNPPKPPKNWQLFIKPAIPAAPVLLLPENKALIGLPPGMDPFGFPTLKVSFSNVAFADHFELQFSTSTNFSNSKTLKFPGDHTGSQAIIQVTNPMGLLNYVQAHYYWRARGINSDGVAGDWSSVKSFTLDWIPPNSPALLSPANGGSVTNSHLSLTWSSIPDAAGYDVLFAPGILADPNNNPYPPPTRLGKVTSYKLPFTIGEGIYSWTVRTYDAAGNVSVWDDVYTINLLAGLSVHKTPTPTLMSPPASPTLTATPTAQPSLTPTPAPAQPTVEPPTAEPTSIPSTPTDEPSSAKPTDTPILETTAVPSASPTSSATPAP
jgi:hypothetical protein